MATRTILGAKVQDAETFTYSTTILQEDGSTPVDLTDANTTVLLTLYRVSNLNAINGRDQQSVITGGTPSNQHTGDAAGLLTFKSLAGDSTFGASVDETVVARYEVTYNDGAAVARTGVHEVQFVVEPLAGPII